LSGAAYNLISLGFLTAQWSVLLSGVGSENNLADSGKMLLTFQLIKYLIFAHHLIKTAFT